jgi:phosphoenolpyruvate-protein phosphotransferase
VSRALRGVPASGGAVSGPVFLIKKLKLPAGKGNNSGSPAHEHARLKKALKEAAVQLDELVERVETEIGPEEAEIFRVQAAFTSDPALIQKAEEEIERGHPAETAITEAFQSFKNQFEQSSSEVIAARAADLDDVRDRILGVLVGRSSGSPSPQVPSVVVAMELTPSQTAELPADMVLAIATETGTTASHATILARALGVPAVVGVDGLVTAVNSANELAIDGNEGVVYVDPDAATRRRIAVAASEAEERRQRLAQLRPVPAVTTDGRRVELAANIGSLSDLEPAVAAGAEGSGLVRTEFLVQGRDRPPSVEEQAHIYGQILAAFPDHRVVFRTLDVGADKPLPFIDRPAEANPALGVRGIRLGLSESNLLHDQLRAIVRACRDGPGAGAVMFPMVTLPTEVTQARQILTTLISEENGPDLEVGAMVETPIAALSAARLARRLDFLSVGSNDLLQYLFAADRLQSELAGLPDIFDPAVLTLLKGVVAAAHSEHAWVGVCGEAAGTVEGAAVFVGLGFDELSMAPNLIPEVKQALLDAKAADLEEAVHRAMSAEDAAEARQIVRSALP